MREKSKDTEQDGLKGMSPEEGKSPRTVTAWRQEVVRASAHTVGWGRVEQGGFKTQGRREGKIQEVTLSALQDQLQCSFSTWRSLK